MKIVTIPLAAQEYTRSTGSGLDQRFSNCVFDEVVDSASNSKSIFVNKRGGLTQLYASVGSVQCQAIWASPSYVSTNSNTRQVIYAFSGGSVYADNVSVGTTSSSEIVSFSETILNGIVHILAVAVDAAGTNSGWFIPLDAVTSLTFTGDTHTNTLIDNITGGTGIYVGQLITGTGIAAGTRVASRTPDTTTPTSITTTIATTATNSGITITRSCLAKIIDADFPTDITGQFVAMNGYIFIMTVRGRIYNSTLNSVVSWSADAYIPAESKTDVGIGCVGYVGKVLGFGSTSLDVFTVTGNSVGSPLSREMGVQLDEGVLFNAGAAGSRSFIPLVQAHDSVYWMSPSFVVFKLNGFTPVNISKSLGKTLSGSKTISGITYSGKRIVVFSGSVSSAMWYQPEENLWSQAAFLGSAMYFSEAFGVVYAAGDTSGKVYTLSAYDSSNFRDDTQSYNLVIQIEPKYLNNGMGFRIPRVDLIADTQASGALDLYLYKDDKLTSTNGPFSIGLTTQYKRAMRCGYYRASVQPYLVHNTNAAFRAQALKLQMVPCTT